MNYHQGDIILERIEGIPLGAKFVRKNIVAYGEVTGHTHAVEEAYIYEKDGVLYCQVEREDTPMVHEEHPKTDIIEKGNYQIRHQQEYFPDGSRQVKD